MNAQLAVALMSLILYSSLLYPVKRRVQTLPVVQCRIRLSIVTLPAIVVGWYES